MPAIVLICIIISQFDFVHPPHPFPCVCYFSLRTTGEYLASISFKLYILFNITFSLIDYYISDKQVRKAYQSIYVNKFQQGPSLARPHPTRIMDDNFVRIFMKLLCSLDIFRCFSYSLHIEHPSLPIKNKTTK